MWKLLGDLLPAQLLLECKRASLSPSEKASHNYIKLSKYVIGNGYDPETFYFNTLYEADRSNSLMGMTTLGQSLPSSANATTTTPVRMSTGVSLSPSTLVHPKLEKEQFILQEIKKMTADIESLKKHVAENSSVLQKETGSGLCRDRHEDLSSLSDSPSWYSFESSSSESSVNSSFFSEKHRSRLESRLVSKRKYDKDLLISNNICLAFQHGTCDYDDDYVGYHPNVYGQKVLHFCGLCETDSPDNQCYYPANKCPGPDRAL